ncbi:MAG: proton-conducting transporter transmembrane domain-containing protein [Desulfotomaculales bacterium]
MRAELSLALALASGGVGILLAPLFPGRTGIRLGSLAVGVAALCGLVAAAAVLAGGPPVAAVLDTGYGYGPLTWGLDPLGAYFAALISMVTLGVALFTPGYLGSLSGRRLRLFPALLNLLYLGLLGVVGASHVALFLVAWEVAAVCAYFLVAFDHEDAHVTSAALTMLVMGEAGSLMVLLGMLLLGDAAGTFDFGGLRALAPALPSATRDVVFLLMLIGFGVKAGLVPFHVWLPLAHPAAPGNVSALLSGAIVGLGVYGFARTVFDLLGAPAVWWGVVLLLLGTLGAVTGVLYALVDRDLKRVLAFSTVENIGLVFVGFGAAVLFRTAGLVYFGALALLTALLHTFNHAAYKGLLFLGAAAVHRATGQKNMDLLGGLVRRMPHTAVLFLVGTVAIAGLPPLNGFVSEWLTFQALLQSFRFGGTGMKLLVALVSAVLALVAALSVTCFLRAFGIPFLAQPRSQEAAAAREVSPGMRLGMAWLAGACLFLGVLAPWFIVYADRAVTACWPAGAAAQLLPPVFLQPASYAALRELGGGLLAGYLPVPGLVLEPAPGFSSASPTYLALFIPLMLLLPLLLARLPGRGVRREAGPVWAGAIPAFAGNMQITATGFTNSIVLLFRSVYRPAREVVPAAPAAQAHWPQRVFYRSRITLFFEEHAYRPVVRRVRDLAHRVSGLQSGNVSAYVAYILVLVVLVLVLYRV